MDLQDESRFYSLPIQDQEFFLDVFRGKKLPPLYSDIIAKKIFNPDAHPDRLNFLLRSISKDPSIEVASSAANEGIRLSTQSKGIITDLPSWMRDGRISNLEFQKAAQEFIFTRGDLYSSDMLLLQYSVSAGQNKDEINYSNVKEALLIILMVDSPRVFKKFESEKYIHRFTQMTADTGISYPLKAKVIYVQLDKCLEQYRAGQNSESDDGKPDKLQKWLATIADVNDEKVRNENDEILKNIRSEMYIMTQEKEVQHMLLQEKYEKMDWASYGAQERREGKLEGMREGKLEGKLEGMREGKLEGMREGKLEGARDQLEQDVRGMYAEGMMPDVISRVTRHSIEKIKEILSRQPNAPALL